MRAFCEFIRQCYRAYLAALGLQRRRCFVQGWANVVRDGEKLAPHCHDPSPHAHVSGNFTVASADTQTIYYPPLSL